MATSSEERANIEELESSTEAGDSLKSHSLQSRSRSLHPQSPSHAQGVTVQRGPQPVICRLTAEVASRLAEIESHSNRPPWSEKLFANEFQNSCSFTYGARLEGTIVGFLVAHAVVDEAHIVNFAVDITRRRNRVGFLLIAHALRDLHLRGIRWVTLEVRASNHPARTLYDLLGFNEVGTRAGYYPDDQEDAVVMSLNIRQFIDSFGPDDPGYAPSSLNLRHPIT